MAPGDEGEVTASLEVYDGLKGTTWDGAWVAQVACVFIGRPQAAAPYLDRIREHGLECRVIAGGREVVIEPGARVERTRRLLPLLRAGDWPHLEHLAEVVPSLGEASGGALFCSGAYGGAAVLLPDRMREVGRRLGSALIAVGIPWDGGFGAVRTEDPVRTEALARWTRDRYDEAPARRIAPTPVLVDQGRPVGFVRLEEEPDPKTAWWRLWG